MALEYYHDVDLKANQLYNSRLHNITSANRITLGTTLGPGDRGYQVYDVDLLTPFWWDGTAWQAPTSAVAWGTIIGTVTAQTDLINYLVANYYPLSSNPANYIDLTDLSAGTGISYNNLTGVITNSAPDQTVVLTGGTGISTSGTYPSFTITNTSPDQLVSLTGGTGISTSGTYPNFTITNSAPDQTVSIGTTGSGLSVTGTYPSFTLQNILPDQTVALTAGTGINTSGTYPNFTITNSAPDQTVALTSGTGISVTGTYPNFTITNTSPSSGGTVTGTGTTNYVPKWSSATALTDSSIFDNGTSVGIGTAAPNATYKLDVLGSTRLGNTTTHNVVMGNGLNFDFLAPSSNSRISSSSSINIQSTLSTGSRLIFGTIGGNNATTGLIESDHTIGDVSQTSGTYVNTRISGRLLNSSGSAAYNYLEVRPTFQTSGSYTGTLRGFYYNPNQVLAFGGTEVAFENTRGSVIHGNLAGVGTRMVTADSTGTLGTTAIPTGTVTGVTATSPITSSGGTAPVISTSMATNRLIGRTTAGTGVMEEISVGTGLTLSAGTLSSTVSGLPKGTTSGTDTYTTTITGVTSYSDGDAYLIRFTNGNTTSATLNINGLGAIPLYRNNDGVLIGGDIIANGEMICVYNSTLTAFQTIGTAPNTLLGYVTNADSVTITKGQVVYAFGGQGDRMTVKLASNTADATSARTVGVVMSTSIAANQKGLIMMQGLLDGLSILPTATWNDGDPVYLGATAGSITPTKPYAPNHLVYIATVTTASNGAAGRMYVNIQNGYELDELHNVQAQSPTYKDTLWYDNTVSPAQWKTASISTILGYTPQVQLNGTGFVKASGTTISYDNSTYYLASNPNSYIPLTALSSTATGLTYTNTTGVFSLTSGYVIPTTTEQSNWNTAYANRITSLTTTGSSGAATLVGNTLNIPQYGGGGLTFGQVERLIAIGI